MYESLAVVATCANLSTATPDQISAWTGELDIQPHSQLCCHWQLLALGVGESVVDYTPVEDQASMNKWAG